jgi:hypothetical protein
MTAAIARGLVGILFVLAGAGGLAEEPERQQTAKPGTSMMDSCKAMMAERGKMMAGMKAADAQIEQLVAKMRAASGEAKVEATADVVAALVEQRKAMREGMTTMQEKMMGHMMEHMEAGPGSMKMCPMMKMGGMKTGGMKQ